MLIIIWNKMFASNLQSFAEACKPGEWQCKDRFHCIPIDEYCDNKKDCIDGSDEAEDCHVNVSIIHAIQKYQFINIIP